MFWLFADRFANCLGDPVDLSWRDRLEGYTINRGTDSLQMIDLDVAQCRTVFGIKRRNGFNRQISPHAIASRLQKLIGNRDRAIFLKLVDNGL